LASNPTVKSEPNGEPRARHRRGTAVMTKGRQRIEAILDAATAILIEDGYGELSTRKNAARAGVRPGHLQYYFRTKQDVVQGLLERYLARATDALAARSGTAAEPATLDAALDGLLADQRDGDRSRFLWELWALAAHDPAVAAAMQAFYRAYWRAVVTTLIATEPALGRPRAERRAALIVALLEGLSLFRTRDERRDLPLPLLERELRSLVRSLATDVG
jgi:AcrR family transcriptional regulator